MEAESTDAGGAEPTVLFACVHNAGRSQMAAALMLRHAGDRVAVLSAGTEPASEVNPIVRRALAEVGVELGDAKPARLGQEDVEAADVVVTMGCGESCPFVPGKRYEDWELDDPAGRELEAVREIRDEIDRRVRRLADELAPRSPA